jgi:hypothetical protein
MAAKITESSIETFTIELHEKHSYQFIYGHDIAPDSESPGRASIEDVLLSEKIKKHIIFSNLT